VDADVKQEFINLTSKLDTHVRNITDKFDAYIKYQQKLCEVKHKPVDEHIKESPGIRDKVLFNSGAVKVIMLITGIMLTVLVDMAFKVFGR
jgi:hypothetical protein